MADKKLNKKATLQYRDSTSTSFIIIISEKKEPLSQIEITPTLEEYFDFAKMGIEQALTKYDEHQTNHEAINNLDAYTCEITGKYNSTKVFYVIGVYESADAYYQVTCWCSDALEQIRSTDFYAVIHSFRML